MSGATLRALVFDYDGLIVDSERLAAEIFVEVMAEAGGAVTIEEIAHLFGTTEADHLWDELITARCELSAAEVIERMTPRIRAGHEELPLLPGVREVLDAARDRGLKVGLATGQDLERLPGRLARLEIHEHFDAVVSAEEVPRGKPHPDIFLEAARRLEVEPAECLALEDSVPGCEAAVAAGMRVVACPSAVTAHCTFPAEARRVTSLLELL
ncbi:MAG TPA: HAD-IA family hydrolase, partial [Acidimicrobiales bacterium]|nr:HAD-IA family hydrolase [Acidimicrobiales bacterium]